MGALFAAVFGETFGVLRLATVVFTAASALAVYGLCRQLGVDQRRSARLGTAIYLFNPLGYVLSFTFMTDGYFTGLVAISAYCYVRGLARVEPEDKWVQLGSVAAALAFLVRQQGILLPLGVLTYLVASGRLRRDRRSRRPLQVMAVPVLAVSAFYLWFNFVHQAPAVAGEDSHLGAWSDAGVSGVFEEIRKIFFVEAIFVGVFTLPLGLAALGRLPALAASTASAAAWLATVVVMVALAAVSFGSSVRLPLVPGFLNDSGLGPTGDLHGGRYRWWGAASEQQSRSSVRWRAWSCCSPSAGGSVFSGARRMPPQLLS